MENVFSHFPTMPNQLIQDAELGTGIIKFVLLALMVGFSMLITLALLFQINVKLMLKMEIVLNVIRDMI